MLLMHKVLLRILFLIPVISYANDPFEEINREVWTFNEGVDNRIARPVAEFYDDVVPKSIQSSITNFFSNLDEIDNSNFKSKINKSQIRSIYKDKLPEYIINEKKKFC